MKISSFFYSVKQGIKNIWRNKMFSIASIATMCACIFLFGLFFIIVTNFRAMVKEAEEGVAVSVFFDEGISQERIDEIGEIISKRPEVARYEFISAEEAWESYKEEYFEGSEEAAEGFADNPLANSASYQIYMNDVSMQDALVVYLESVDGVREVHHSEAAAKTLSDFNRLISYISVGVILILLVVAVFLISNTVTVGISVRREEIGIMKLIGATNLFVRTPFLIEGVVLGVLGALLPMIVLFFGYRGLVGYIMEEFNLLTDVLQFLPVETLFTSLLPISLLLSVGIGFFGSFFTTRRHLSV